MKIQPSTLLRVLLHNLEKKTGSTNLVARNLIRDCMNEVWLETESQSHQFVIVALEELVICEFKVKTLQ